MTTVAVAYTPRPAIESPNLHRGARARGSDTYYRSIVVTFASVRRWNENLQLLFVTDGETPQPYASALEALDVTTERVAFEHLPPAGFARTFIASLYSLDALRLLSSMSQQQVLLLDPDILCRGDLSPLLTATRGSVGALPIDVQPDENVNGITSTEAVTIHRQLDRTLSADLPTHYGGECYVIDASYFPTVLGKIDCAWRASLTNFGVGMKYLTTEEHLMNFALRYVPVVSARPYIARIWTTRTVRTVPDDVDRLALWHLPSEKDRAFQNLFAPAVDRTSWFWTACDDNHARMVRRLTQIPRRSPGRFASDIAARSVRRAQAIREHLVR